MAGIFKTAVFTLPTSSNSTWDCDISGWPETPVAAIIEWVRNDGATGSVDGWSHSYGFCATDQGGTPTLTQSCLATFAENNSDTTSCNFVPVNNRSLWAYGYTLNSAGNFDNEDYCSTLDVVNFHSGGIRFNYRHGSTYNCGSQLIHITFIVCDHAFVDTTYSGDGDSIWQVADTTVTAPGFPVEALFMTNAVTSYDYNVEHGDNLNITYSFAAGSGTSVEQAGVGIAYLGSVGTVNIDNITRDHALPNASGGDIGNNYLEIDEFTSTGFITTTYNQCTTCHVGYLALDFGGDISFEVGVGSFPTSTSGNHDEPSSSMGFYPGFVYSMAVWNTSLNTGQDSNSGAFSWNTSIITEDNQYSLSVSEEDGSDTTNNQSRIEAKAFVMPQGDGTTAYDADFGGFKNGYWTLDWDTTSPSTGRYFTYFAAQRTLKQYADTTSLGITGQSVDLQYKPAIEIETTSVNINNTIDVGLQHKSSIEIETTAFDINTIDIGLQKDVPFDADTQSATIDDTISLILEYDKVIRVDTDSVDITISDIDLEYARKIAVETESFVIDNAIDVPFIHGIVSDADTQSVIIDDTISVNFDYDRAINVDTDSIDITQSDIVIAYDKELEVDTIAFTIDDTIDVELYKQRIFSADNIDFDINVNSIKIYREITQDADTISFSITQSGVELEKEIHAIFVDSTSLLVDEKSVDLKVDYKILIDSIAYTIDEKDLELGYGRSIVAESIDSGIIASNISLDRSTGYALYAETAEIDISIKLVRVIHSRVYFTLDTSPLEVIKYDRSLTIGNITEIYPDHAVNDLNITTIQTQNDLDISPYNVPLYSTITKEDTNINVVTYQKGDKGDTGTKGDPGEDGENIEVPYAKRIDFITDNLLYRAEAVPGTLDNEASWRIRRITIAGDNDIVEEWAYGSAAFDQRWTDRLTIDYS